MSGENLKSIGLLFSEINKIIKINKQVPMKHLFIIINNFNNIYYTFYNIYIHKYLIFNIINIFQILFYEK